MSESRESRSLTAHDVVAPSTPSIDFGLSFGRFVLFPVRQVLVDGSTELKLGSRAAALLQILAEQAGRVVAKEEILRAVWPGANVDDGNLRVQIAQLRKLLKDDNETSEFILNVVGRGYQFIAPVTKIQPDGSSITPIPLAAQERIEEHRFPLLTEIFGRDDCVQDLKSLLERQRQVTIVGPGGVGKTTLALLVGQDLRQSYGEFVHFVDLSRTSADGQLYQLVATSLGIALEARHSAVSIVSRIRDRRAVIILDNCEHLVDAVAHLSESLRRGAPQLRILATSRESLRAEGEWLFKADPLEIPPVGTLPLAEAEKWSAVQLFMNRARANDSQLSIKQDDVPLIAEICTRLDGIPLAIEIAATQVNVHGIAGVAACVRAGLDVLSGGRRTAARRHGSMRDTFEWSHQHLTNDEQILLRRLAIFPGAFSLEAAALVCGDQALSNRLVTEAVGSLVRKSLLQTNAGNPITYRQSVSMRQFAREKLTLAKESIDLGQRHLDYTLIQLDNAQREWIDTRRDDWIEKHAGLVEDVREAIRWAFADEAQIAVGIRLTAMALPLVMQLGFAAEFKEHAATALRWCDMLSERELVAEMRLNIAYAALTQGKAQPMSHEAPGVARAAYLADLTGNDNYRLEAHVSIAPFFIRKGDYVAALEHARLATTLAAKTRDDLAIVAARRVLSQAAHCAGDLEQATTLAKSVLAHPNVNIPFNYGGIHSDQRVSMRVILARSLWMQGNVDKAAEIVRETIDTARDDGPLALCQALALAACPVFLWRGDEALAGEYVTLLLSEASTHNLPRWHSWGRLYSEVLRQRSASNGEKVAFSVVPDGEFQAQTLATLNGQIATIDFSQGFYVGDGGWCTSELIRLRGEQLVHARPGEALDTLKRSFEVSRAANGLSWQLRSSLSLGAHLVRLGNVKDGHSMVMEVFERFKEGLDTADLHQARSFLETTS